jgi:hypothetical protein
MAWYTSGLLVNPGVDAILADTGPMTAATRKLPPEMIVSSSVPIDVMVEHRDAANSTNLNSHRFRVQKNVTHYLNVSHTLAMGANERVRIRLVAAVTGTVQASILA